MQNINSYNLSKFEFICWLVFEKKMKKMKKKSFVCLTITGVKLTYLLQNSL